MAKKFPNDSLTMSYLNELVCNEFDEELRNPVHGIQWGDALAKHVAERLCGAVDRHENLGKEKCDTCEVKRELALATGSLCRIRSVL